VYGTVRGFEEIIYILFELSNISCFLKNPVQRSFCRSGLSVRSCHDYLVGVEFLLVLSSLIILLSFNKLNTT